MNEDVELMRWQLDALSEWVRGMLEQPAHPQYGRDVKTILNVTSMDEAQEIDRL